MSGEEVPLWQRDERRFIERRKEYLKRVLSVDERKAVAVAYSELGYSDAGIAQEMNVTAGTVTSWLDDVADRHGLKVVLAKRPDELGVEAGIDPAEVRDE